MGRWRLPTEAEWESACRSTDARLYPWGDQAPTDTLSNFNNDVGETVPVGSYPDGVSPFGTLDMSGNVWEWTSSLDVDYPYDATDGREDADADGKRIVRGGSFYYTQYQLRCTTRMGFDPTTANQHFGLRVVRTAVDNWWEDPASSIRYVYVPGRRVYAGPQRQMRLSLRWSNPRTSSPSTVSGFSRRKPPMPSTRAASTRDPVRHPKTICGTQLSMPTIPLATSIGRRQTPMPHGPTDGLPTEAEWERACRGDDGRLFPWGSDVPRDDLSNFNSNVGETVPVGSYPDGVSPFGLLDMSGNVWEWTSTLDTDYPYDATDGREDADAAGERMVRGGSFYYTQYQLRCTTRSPFSTDTANQHFGLRVVYAP